MKDATLFHVARRADLQACADSGHYRAASLDTEGFLHCCHTEQLAGVVSRWFEGVDDLVLLTLDPERLDAPLVHENTTGGTELFPHLYGPIPIEAITERCDIGLDSPRRRALTGEPS